MPRGAGSTSCTGSADRRQPQRAGAVGHHGMGIRLKIIIGALVAGLCVIAVAPGMAQLAPEIAARRTETLRQEMVFRDADRYTYGAPSRVEVATSTTLRRAWTRCLSQTSYRRELSQCRDTARGKEGRGVACQSIGVSRNQRTD